MARKPAVAQHICAILAQKHLLSATGIVQELSEQFKQYNKTSVYRALESLLADGIVCRQLLAGSEVLYELREHHHDHTVCTSCQTVNAIECQSHPAPVVQGFAVDHHHTTMYGVCDACRNNVSKNS